MPLLIICQQTEDLAKSQIFKITQPGGTFDSWVGNLGRKELTYIPIPLENN